MASCCRLTVLLCHSLASQSIVSAGRCHPAATVTVAVQKAPRPHAVPPHAADKRLPAGYRHPVPQTNSPVPAQENIKPAAGQLPPIQCSDRPGTPTAHCSASPFPDTTFCRRPCIGTYHHFLKRRVRLTECRTRPHTLHPSETRQRNAAEPSSPERDCRPVRFGSRNRFLSVRIPPPERLRCPKLPRNTDTVQSRIFPRGCWSGNGAPSYYKPLPHC